MFKWDFCKWSARDYQSKVLDPYTKDKSRSARLGHDPLHTNSLDNGMLMCLDHHKGFDTFRFSIHPEVRSSLLVCFLLAHMIFLRPTESTLSTLLLSISMTNSFLAHGKKFIRIWSLRVQNFFMPTLYQQ